MIICRVCGGTMCSVCYVHDEWTGHHGRSTSSVGTSGVPRQSATENSARCLQHNGFPGDFLLCIISAGFNVSIVLLRCAVYQGHFLRCVICVFCLLVVWCCAVSTSASDWLERLVSKMTYNVLMGKVNHTRSLTLCYMYLIVLGGTT